MRKIRRDTRSNSRSSRRRGITLILMVPEAMNSKKAATRESLQARARPSLPLTRDPQQ
jgi:hypothetical protein